MVYLNNFIKEKRETLIYGWIIHGQSLFENRTGSIDGAVTPGTVAGRAEGSKIESCTADVTIDGQKSSEQIGKTDVMYESADQ